MSRHGDNGAESAAAAATSTRTGSDAARRDSQPTTGIPTRPAGRVGDHFPMTTSLVFVDLVAVNILDARSLLAAFGVAGIFVVLFAETGLLVGFFLPGDSLLFTAGLL